MNEYSNVNDRKLPSSSNPMDKNKDKSNNDDGRMEDTLICKSNESDIMGSRFATRTLSHYGSGFRKLPGLNIAERSSTKTFWSISSFHRPE